SYSGQATWYKPGLGACQNTHGEGELVAAINLRQWNKDVVCGTCVQIKGFLGGTVKVKIVDLCPECNHGSLDLSPAAFKHISLLTVGRLPIEWTWA
ncbi:RlpA-like double-psi beta-barrel-protein domain-containing protein-containing protein, partial [Dimargaris cristalligena]